MATMGDETRIIAWLRDRQRSHSSVVLGVGDDMAVVRSIAETLLISSDMLLDGVHFDTTRHDPESIGRKAVGCCLSDCAAMAVRPMAATVSLALPGDLSTTQATLIMEGAVAMAESWDARVVGGDTTRWSGRLAIDVAIVAEPYPGVMPVRRSGALPGDRLYVTGTLGGSLLGRHLQIVPRIRESQRLAQDLGCDLHAMIDITDGLSLDLSRMCEASGVGAALEMAALERAAHHDALRAASADGRSVLDHVLSDGEDFELLVAVAPDAGVSDTTLFAVGTVTERELVLSDDSGRIVPLDPKGFVH